MAEAKNKTGGVLRMVYAPVTIPTICRSEHFIRCVESLKRNSWAKYTGLFIGVDYPTKEQHWPGYRRILDYLQKPIPEFKAVHTYIREKNLGSGMNAYQLRLACKERFDRFIYMDDDLEVSQNFLQYMDETLEAYLDDPKVIAVTGYAYPLNWIAAPGCTVVKQNFNASAWGRGFWFKKMPEIYKYLHKSGILFTR